MKHQPILFAFCAALALYPITLLVLHFETNGPPGYYWSQFASDWGSIIGGTIAAFAAGGTVWAVYFQTRRSIAAVRRQTRKTVHAMSRQTKALRKQTQRLLEIEDRRVATEYVAHLRTNGQKMLLSIAYAMSQVDRMAEVFAAHSRWVAGDPMPSFWAPILEKDEREITLKVELQNALQGFERDYKSVFELVEPPNMSTGHMPGDFRLDFAKTVGAMTWHFGWLRDPKRASNRIRSTSFADALHTLVHLELEVFATLVRVEFLARKIEESHKILASVDEPSDKEIEQIVDSEKFRLAGPKILEKYGMKFWVAPAYAVYKLILPQY